MCEPSKFYYDRTVVSGVETSTSTVVFDHEIAHLTKLRSGPSKHLSKMVNWKSKNLISPVKMLAAREANYLRRSKFSSADSCHLLSRYLPGTGPFMVDRTESRAYVSQFSGDGSLLVAGFQDSNIRIYNAENGWNLQKDILAKNLRWTITDTSLSPDQRYLVYSSMSPIVHIVNVGSVVTKSLANVTDDVNTVCFADESGNLMYSGSDDSLCKVWDRRCLNPRGRPAGTLVGHLEGITFIDSRGDGRYFISNGKDQTIKLWDIRKMSSNYRRAPARQFKAFDYRWMEYPPKLKEIKHPNDQSLTTYRGHSVLRTLIRCHFSPEYSTGQKYIYTGSNDGAVYIYDVVSGALVSKLDHHETTVRDCSWHPSYPMIVSSSWDGTVVRSEIRGDDDVPPPPLKHRSGRRRHFL